MSNITTAVTDQAISSCYPVMAQLRPHIQHQAFISKIKAQIEDGYKLAYIQDGDSVVAVAGYRINSNLAWGSFLYVDDLITDEAKRSRGFGKQLTDWLIQEAKNNNCSQLHLDSGLQRKDAHRFYDREEIEITGYHFARKL